MKQHPLSRRALLAGASLGLLAFAAPAEAAKKHDHGGQKKKAAAEATDATKGVQITYPRLVELKHGETFDLVAEPATQAFLQGKPAPIVGYGGTYMGPALRVKRGTTPTVRLVNRLDRPTNVHWHGLLVDGPVDGGTTPGIAPGGTWEAKLPVDQPAATLWYHAHIHGSTTQDVHDGLAGVLIVDDDRTAALGLPSTWGVDDLALVLQDRDFDAAGKPVRPPVGQTLEHGFRGATMIVNGTADAATRVPTRLVRLRLVNASGARTFRLFFEDQRVFRLIATDAGLLDAPVELSYLPLASGERAEILVDFAEGISALMTGPDEHEHRMGADVTTLPDVLAGPTRVLAFEATKDSAAAAVVPKTLAPLAALPGSTDGLKRRRFELRVAAAGAGDMPAGHDHAAMMQHAAGAMPGMDHGNHADPTAAAPLLAINGKPFAMGRIDERIPLGATEVWEIVSPEMAHPFHLHGAHFRVLSEDGGQPKLWNRGSKDTVLVENSAELLVTFTRRAGEDAPFVYHCHLLEHEDGGMMGAFTVG